MNRNEKQLIVDALKNEFNNSQASFLIEVQGLTVETVQGLRRNLISKGGHLKVAKNTLLKRAVSDIEGATDLNPFFKKQIAIVFAKNEAPAVAKILYDAAKEHEPLKFVVGSMDKKIISKEQIEFLATLPSREILLAQLVATINSPMMYLVGIIDQLKKQMDGSLEEKVENNNNKTE